MNTTKKNLFCVFLCAIMMIFALAVLAPMSSMKGVYADDAALDETTATVKVTANGETSYYASFADAVGAANNGTITLLKDSQICGFDNKTLTIDLNGKTLSGSDVTFRYSNVTIKDNVGTGEITPNIYSYGYNITIESGKISYVFVTDIATLVIKGGKLNNVLANKTTTISGGEVEKLIVYDTSILHLSGGTINSFKFSSGVAEDYKSMLKVGYAYKSVETGDIIKASDMTTSTKVSVIQCPHKTQKGEISFTECVCDYCNYECLHTGHYDATNGTCEVCGYECLHDSYDNSICEVCGYECPHTGHYDANGLCRECGYQCLHAQYNERGVCEECGYQCPHTNLNNDFVCEECHNGIEACVSNESTGTNCKYTSIVDAVAGLTAGDTLTLYKDIDSNNTITIGVSCTLDLNGCSISGYYVDISASVIITDSKDGGFLAMAAKGNGFEVQLRGKETTTFRVDVIRTDLVKFYSGRIASMDVYNGNTIKNLLPNGYIFVENSNNGTTKTKLKISECNGTRYNKDGYYLTCEECTHTEIEITEAGMGCAYCGHTLSSEEAISILQRELQKSKTELNESIEQKEDVSIVNEKIEQLNNLIASTESTLNNNLNNLTSSQESLESELRETIENAKQSAVNSANVALEQAKNNLQESVNGKLDIVVYNQRVAELSDAIDNAEVASKAYADSQDAALKTDLENKINQAKSAMQTANQTMLERLEKAEKEIASNSSDIESLRQTLTAMIIIVALFIAISVGGLIYVIFRNRKKQIMIVNSANEIDKKIDKK